MADEDAFCKKSSLIMQMTNMGVIKHMRTFEQKRTPFFLLINNCRLCITPSAIRATLLCNNNNNSDCPGQNYQSTVVVFLCFILFSSFKKKPYLWLNPLSSCTQHLYYIFNLCFVMLLYKYVLFIFIGYALSVYIVWPCVYVLLFVLYNDVQM